MSKVACIDSILVKNFLLNLIKVNYFLFKKLFKIQTRILPLRGGVIKNNLAKSFVGGLNSCEKNFIKFN